MFYNNMNMVFNDSVNEMFSFFRCPVDPTFSIRRYGNGQKLSFHSFAFTHDDNAKLYLHCEVIACLPQSACGICNKTGNRKRRDALFAQSLRLNANAFHTRD